MIRSLSIFAFAAILFSVLSAPFIGIETGVFVLGGHYQVGSDETLNEDMNFFFAQVTIDENASVDGHIFLFSSSMDLHGNVSEDIHAFESDLTLRETAHVNGKISQSNLIQWTLLLPAIAQVP